MNGLARRSLLTLAGAAITLPLAACQPPVPLPPPTHTPTATPTPTPTPTASAATATVGTLAVRWAREDEADQLQRDLFSRGETLLRDQAAWEAWVSALPPAMLAAKRAELAAVDLASAVAIVAYWARCDQDSAIEKVADGELRFVLRTGPGGPRDCEWSPERLEVWLVGLDEAGVSDRARVRLVE